MISMSKLSASMRRRAKVERMAPVIVHELGVMGAAEALAAACLKDAEDADRKDRPKVAALLREAAAVYRVAARRLKKTTSEAWRLHLSGDEDLSEVAT
jgi:hypothetical protein